jgi:peroxiredoxin
MAKRWSVVLLWTLVGAMAVTNVLLLGQNLRLRREVVRLQPPSLREGDRVPSFAAVGLSGESIDVSYTGGGPKKVLFYFSPTCRFCKRQFPYWKAILERAADKNFEVLGIVSQAEDAAKVEDFLRGMGCSSESNTPLRVARVPRNVLGEYKLSATPITLIVANDGRVEKAWNGQWSNDELATVYPIFGLNVSP